MVPKDKVTRLRMKLAEGGLPKGGGVGYEIFDKSDALGTTSFVQNINHLRALEGELARTIRAIDRIQAARVHLVLPERPLFSRETPEPSASIVLRVRGALEPQQVRAIRHVVASAVNGLKPQRVSIVDEAGRLLADGASRRRRPTAPPATSAAPPSRSGCATRSRPSSPRWSAPAAPGSSSPPTSTTTRSPRPRTSSIPRAGCCAPARPARNPRRPPTTRRPGHRQQRTARRPGQRRRAGARDQSKKTRRNQQLRDFPHHQDRGHRGRPRQPDLGRGAGRRHLRQERQGRAGLSGRAARKQLDRIAALVRSAIGFDQKRGDQVEVVNLRFAEAPGGAAGHRADRPARHAAVHQGRRHVRHRARRHDAARPRGAVHGDPPAGQAHPGRRSRSPRWPTAPLPALTDGSARRRRPARPCCPAPAAPQH